jgi:hypothetical protein
VQFSKRFHCDLAHVKKNIPPPHTKNSKVGREGKEVLTYLAYFSYETSLVVVVVVQATMLNSELTYIRNSGTETSEIHM